MPSPVQWVAFTGESLTADDTTHTADTTELTADDEATP